MKNFSRLKLLLFSLIPLVLLLLAGELFCRVKLYLEKKDTYYLTAPFFEKEFEMRREEKARKALLEYKSDINKYFPKTENYYYKLKPGSYPCFEEYPARGNYTINSLGFRGKEFDPSDKNAKIRIFCVGASSTFDRQSADDKTYPARLEYYLGERYEVINSGFASYTSPHYLNLIRHELINYQPDIFIIYGGMNEFHTPDDKRTNRFVRKIHRLLYFRYSIFYSLLTEKISVMLHKSSKPIFIYSIDPAKAIDDYQDNIEQIVQICRDNNIQLVFVRQMLNAPKELFLSDDLEEIPGNKLNYGIVRDKKKLYTHPSLFYYHNRLTERLKEICQRHKLELLDFREEFSTRDDLYFDFVHLTPQANDLLARLISEKIRLQKEGK